MLKGRIPRWIKLAKSIRAVKSKTVQSWKVRQVLADLIKRFNPLGANPLALSLKQASPTALNKFVQSSSFGIFGKVFG